MLIALRADLLQLSCASTPPDSLPSSRHTFVFDERCPYEKESHSLCSPSISAFQRLELVRLRPLLPGQQAGGHCERAGLTKSTSFPRAVRKGIGRVLEPMKEDCSNKISVQEKEGRWTRELRTGEENDWERAMRGHSETSGSDGWVVERGKAFQKRENVGGNDKVRKEEED